MNFENIQIDAYVYFLWINELKKKKTTRIKNNF